MKTPLFLLCLLWSLVEVHSQTAPYVTFMGETLPNHAYVGLNLVGNNASGSDSVQCHTDLVTCCSSDQGVHRGDWIPPGSDPFSNNMSADIYESHGAQQVDLHRRNSTDMPSGIYRCDIPTNTVHDATDVSVRDSVYVGLYVSGGNIAISNVTLTVDSDLNGASPQFTLTCISTGGPATTVIWTRDSEMLSGSTVLNDTETAQYTHTLTVTGRLGGLYTCNVSNDKPSEAMSNLRVQVASAPTNLMAVQEGVASIRVSWNPPTPLGDTTGYRIYYSGGSVNVSGGSTDNYLLTSLLNGNSFNISIVAISPHFFSVSLDVTVNLGVYLSLDDDIIPNHGYVVISGIGSTDDTALICYTNRPASGANSGGDWFGPTGIVVGGLTVGTHNVPGFMRNRDPMIVRLLRNTATDPPSGIPSEGIFHCGVEDATFTVQTIYVGLYNSGGGNITLSNVTFTANTDLNGASPQFTLTCISTGGPATTVIWTRDSEMLTGSTVLTDTETAQYTHTLTVTGRLEGLYTCTVSNDKPSEDSAQLLVQAPSPPSAVVVSPNELPGSILVSWIPPSGESSVTGYIIYYQQDGGQRLSVSAEVAATTAAITGLEGGTYSIAMVTTSSTLPSTETAAQTVTLVLIPVLSVNSTATSFSLSWTSAGSVVDSYEVMWISQECPDDVDEGNTTITDGSTNYTIEDLREGTSYNITVTASNAVSSASNSSASETQEIAPSAAPTFVSVSEVTSFSITVQWGAVDCIHRNGDITGYSMRYGVQGSGSTQTMSVSGGNGTILSVMPSTNYSIEVAAENSNGTGVYSDSVRVETPESVYLSLDDDIIPNHGYVVISDIGSTDDTALICYTNRPASGANSGGDWFGPTGIVVGGLTVGTHNVPGFMRNRDPMIVRLLRNTATDPPSGIPSEGIFHCEVEDATFTVQTVYVGLYNSGGGNITLSNVTFTANTDLNGASPQFTLTCISTGGPATTVTWTRDSEMLTGSTVLNDTETAQYTHTLTVTGRLEGLYTCTVSNDKPSEDSAQLFVLAPSPPSAVSVSPNELPRSILVSWIPPSGESSVTGYIIYYQQDGGQRLSVSAEVAATTAAITGLAGGTYSITMVTTSSTLPSTETAAQTVTLVLIPVLSVNSTATSFSLSWTSAGSVVDSYEVMWISQECPDDVDEGNTTITDGSTNYTIEDLREGTSYNITVTASNAVSSASNSSASETQEIAPSAAPTFVSVSEVTSFSITVQWGAVDCIHRNGDITGYSMRYGVQGSGSTQTMSVSGGNATILSVMPSTNYSIEVAAENSNGTGVYSDSVRVETPESVYLSLDDDIIPNHGYVVISDIGSTDDTALICYTNRPASGANSGGDWFGPTGIVVGGLTVGTHNVPGFMRNRDPMIVRLLRNTATDPPSGIPSEGIFHCEVEDATFTVQTVYVGLYNSGGGNITLSNVTFTANTDLNGASPQFTLTCISTGGPATTVTWTRDSEMLTGSTVLNDTETAQYTHTLTVTGRLEGLYTCTVSNDKPSEDSAQLFVLAPSPPSAVSVSPNELPRSILVSWIPPSGESSVTGYIIYYQQDGGQRLSVSAEVAATTAAITGLAGGTYSITMVTTSSTLPSTETAAQTVTLVLIPVLSVNSTATSFSLSWTSAGSVVDSYEVMWISQECPDDVDEGNTTITDGSTNYTIEDLREGTSYNITVTASNAVSSASNSSASETQEIAPSAAPTFVSVSEVTSFSITVQWGAVDCIHRNGDITGYSMRYGVQGSGSTQTMSVSGGNATILSVMPSTNYSIEVAAENSNGTGVYSDSVRVETPESVYLSLDDDIIPNHGYVVISDIGSTDDTALICYTNRPASGANSGGDWFGPTGIVVGGLTVGTHNVPGFMRNRDPMIVRLLRNTATDPPSGIPSEGIFHCEVEDATFTVQTVYVGLYNSGGGNITLSNVTFTANTDLNGASPQFTLTCISTGGPATTVTWTRDSEMLTGSTVLNDTETAQYTHTLTVTGRLEGLYTCTVSNDKPSEDSAQLFVLAPSPPSAVSVSPNELPRSILVSWIPPSGESSVTGYIIYYQQDGGQRLSVSAEVAATTAAITGLAGGTYSITMVTTSSTLPSTETAAQTVTLVLIPVLSVNSTATSFSLSWTSAGSVVDSYEVMWISQECPDDVDEGNTTITDGSTNYTIEDLREGTSYNITVTASNAVSSASNSSASETQEIAPSAAPTFVSVSEVTSFSITVQWGAVDCIHRNGDITGYSMRYGVQGSGSTQTMSVSGGNATILSVMPSTNYSIEVAAENSNGTGVYSDSVRVETPESVYLSLDDDIIPNHGYVVISGIGSTDDTALICYTNRPASGANSGGDWFGPTGIVVGGLTVGTHNVPGFMRNRDPMIVRLLRNTATDPPSGIPSEGIFHCEVEDATFTVQTVYVGLYNSGGGNITLSNVTFTANTDLNGASPQFTLTCISTGGPATTVTWTRDSEMLTGSTVLNDTETAQYTHTLTVTGRLEGLYTCTVSNDKPSEDSAQLFVLAPSPPSAVSVSPNELPRSILVSWIPPSGESSVTGYIIYYQQDGGQRLSVSAEVAATTAAITGLAGGTYSITMVTTSSTLPSTETAAQTVTLVLIPVLSVNSTATSFSLSWTSAGSVVDSYEVMWISQECPDDVDEGNTTITDGSTNYTIEDLREGTSYNITVTASNAVSSASNSSASETQEIAPSAAPTFVSVSEVTSFSITVQWGAVDCIHRNGDITGYSMRYGVQGSGSTQTMSVSGGNATILSVMPSTNYSIEVAAENSNGTGVYSDSVRVETPESVYLSLDDDIIPNHGYVVISGIGSTDDTALICYTNRPASGANSGGDWFGPTGIVVGGLTVGTHNVPGFMRNRDPMIVRLLRNTATDPPSGIPSEGIFHCEVEDATFTVQTVYVGLYNSGGGNITLSNVTFTANTDLNGASPQFTLTCISTGGPATTVTWTRDSEMLTGSTVLNDTETAQYTHTLTVTGRLEGLYTCTVSNDKPSEDSAQLFVLAPSPPSAVSVSPNELPRSILVSWIPPSGESSVTGYIIYYQQDGGQRLSVSAEVAATTAAITGLAGGTYSITMVTTSSTLPSTETAAQTVTLVLIPVLSVNSTATSFSLSWTSAGSVVDSYEVMWISQECPDDVDEGNTTITDGSTNYTIEDLREGTSYNITVTASNAVSSASNSSASETQEIAPSAAPTFVSVSEVTSFSITVQWGAVDCIHRNGDITGYSMRYGVQGSGSTQTMSVSGGNATILSVMPSTNYSIEVAAENSNGTGVYSDSVRVETPESVYLSLDDDIIPNHGYVVISDIGSTDDTALICYTNRPASGANSGGDWFGPTGIVVGGLTVGTHNVPGFMRNRDPMIVRLLRNTATDPPSGIPSEGIFHCEVEDATFTVQTVYVGLYNSGGGNITLSNVTFTANTDLNGASPQFTLTCISTGGPATTVTWTRDSEMLTGSTVLNDTETAQYTHTLTVTGRLEGLYTCTVSNDKPSEDSAQLFVLAPSPPSAVSVSPNELPRSILVSWIPPSGESSVTGYIIYYQQDGGQRLSVSAEVAATTAAITGLAGGTYSITMVTTSSTLPSTETAAQTVTLVLIPVLSVNSTATSFSLSWTSAGSVVDSYEVMWISQECPDDVDEGNTTITDGSTNYTIEDLREGTSYNITVTASNAVSSASNSSASETQEIAPSAAPTFVSVSEVTSFSITVQWGAVDCIHRNGDITGYSMRYGVQGSGSTQTMSVSGGNGTILSVMPSTNYSIEVAAENSNGTGVYSDSVRVETPESVYLSLDDDIIPNHGYVVISDIGSTDDTALICYTNRPASGANSGGDWFGPTGIVVGGLTVGTHNVPGFMRNRDPMIVRLLRNTATDPPSGIPSEGIFHCEVEDATFTVQTVYVGLYNSGGGNITLSNVTFTANTDLNGASPQFTLTCISTGGPATTVTWTRDSEMLTGSTVLNDTETAQYTHTLTVTGRLEGLYTCTVSNDKPSEDSAQLFVLAPSPPSAVSVSPNELPRSILVSWIPPSGESSVTGYIIYYQQDGGQRLSVSAEVAATTAAITGLAGGTYSITMVTTSSTLPSTETAAQTVTLVLIPVLSVNSTATSFSLSWTSAGSVVDSYEVMWISQECPDDVDEGNTTITDGSTNYTIEDLREGTSYNITVTASNAVSSASNSSASETQEIAPSAAPTFVSVSEVTSFSITVQWGAVDCIHRNGDITGYSMRYGVQGSGSTQTMSVSGGNATILSVMPSTNYSIEVAAENSNGTGVYSDSVRVETPESVYLSLDDDIIPNHGYVVISGIGSTDDTALICYTNRPASGANSGGDWFGPTGIVVGGLTVGTHNVPGFMRNRDPMIVRLLRNTATDPPSGIPSEGIFHCEVEDATFTVQTVYVGLYNSGGGNITLSNVTFTANTDLNGASPQFTLTCISTGGPATTVTWTRDSEMLTGSTVLNDTETAQYTHTLTVTGRLEGLYTCTVSNDKPSEDSAQLFVLAPSPPSAVSVSPNELPRSILVSWIPPSGESSVTGYIIYYQQDGGQRLSVSAEVAATTAAITGLAGGTYSITMVTTSSTLPSTETAAQTVTLVLIPVLSVNSTATSFSLSWTSAGSVVDSYEVMWISQECPDDVDEGNTTITDGSTNYTIEDLREGTSYNITVTASNAVSSASNSSASETQEIAPSAAPTFVSVSEVTSFSITVQWGAVDCIHRNGDITGYSMRYGVQGSGSTQTMSVSGGNGTILSVMPSTNYSIEVAAENSNGTGVYSDSVRVETPESVYLSLDDDIIPNHGYVVISDIGSTDDTALICYTNRPASGANSGGDWFGPTGIVVGGLTVGTHNVPGFMRNRDPMIVRLLRNTATDPPSGIPSEGIFHCEVEDATFTVQTVYVGLYNSGGGNITLSNVTFTANTDLNGASPQFTLTCISTGGPATTVTWTRDSEMLTGSTVLNDTETAQYTHTLTVTGRLEGLYTCTVSNDKPSEDSAQLFVQAPSPPSAVSVSPNELPRSILVSWIPPSGESSVTGYIIYYQQDGGQRLSVSAEVAATTAVITGLAGGTYSITMVTTSSTLPSTSTAALTATIVLAPVLSVNFTTTTSISLTWTSAGSVVDSYEVMWISQECSDDVDEGNTTITDGSTNYTIEDLRGGTSYNITVTASNAVSSASNSSASETQEIAPSAAPTFVSVSEVTSFSITVLWEEVDCIHRNGDITGYSVRYGVQGSGSTQTMSVSGGNATILSVMPSTNYSIEVAAENSNGTGVFSDSLIVETHESVYLSLNNDIPNHGYVVISDIGSTDDTALICYTNRPARALYANSGGDWFGPTGIVVGGLTIGIDNVPGFMRNRDPMIVRLLRNTATDPPSGIPSEGIFHCAVEDATFTVQTVYIGLYNSGGGDITLSDVALIADTNLNGVSPKFILTCISTGGPATTVTWTRDSEMLTGSTALNDTETAQYIHTLTVTGRLEGLYTCTVSNNKPSEDSAELTIQAAYPVDEFETVTSSETSLTFSWSLPSIATHLTTGYRLKCTPLLEGIPIPVALMLGSAAVTANMTGLHSGVTYNCSIVTISFDGVSQPQILTPSTTEVAPAGFPEMFSAVAGQRQVAFSWSPPLVTLRNGFITSYTLSCSPSPSSLPQSPSHAGSLNVAGFSPDTSYSCSVAASNSQGAGSFALTTFTTLQDYMYFQLRLGGVVTCSELIVTSTEQKLKDITNAVLEELTVSCTDCGIASDIIDKQSFVCFPESPTHVTYRARLEGTSETDSGSLISRIEKWTSDGSRIIVTGVLMTVDSECLVAISSLSEGECQPPPTIPTPSSSMITTDSTASSSSSNTASIIAGVVVAVFSIVAIIVAIVVIVALILKHRRGGLSIKNAEEHAMVVLPGSRAVGGTITTTTNTAYVAQRGQEVRSEYDCPSEGPLPAKVVEGEYENPALPPSCPPLPVIPHFVATPTYGNVDGPEDEEQVYEQIPGDK